MRYHKGLLFFFIYSLTTTSFAAFCPTNFNVLRTGDTVENVIALCGKPDKQETKERKPPTPQEWTYFVPQTVSANTTDAMQGTLKTQITFDNNGNAINISVNGIGVGATSICNNVNIALGASRETIKAACGDPTFINKDANPATLPDSGQKPIKVTTFTYNTNPPTQLVFEDGQLMGD